MARNLYDLVVSLGANITKFEEGMTRAATVSAQTANVIQKQMQFATSAMQTLGLGISAAGVIAFAKHTLDAADNLHKMSQKVGESTEELSKLQYVADLAGVSSDTLGKGLKKLSQEMTAAGDSSSKSAKIMSALGVDISKGLGPAIDSIATAFVKLPDGPLKATLATEVFSKAGMDMIPMLNAGADGIRQVKDEAVRLGLVLDKETAAAAERTNDNLRAVSKASEGAARSMLENLSPSLVRISAAMKQAAEEGGTLHAIWVGLGGAASEMLGMNDSEAEKAKRRAREIAAELTRLNKEIRDGESAGIIVQQALIDQRRPRIMQLEAELSLINTIRKAEAGQFDDQATRAARQGRGVVGGTDAALAARLNTLLSQGSQVQKFESALAAAEQMLASSLAKSTEGSIGLTEARKKLLSVMQSPEWDKFSEKEKERIKTAYERAAAIQETELRLKHLLEAEMKLLDIDRETEEQISALVRVGDERILNLQEQIDNDQLELSLIGATNIARDIALLQFQKERDLRGPLNDEQRKAIELKYSELEALARLKDVRQNDFDNQISMYQELGHIGRDFTNAIMSDNENMYDWLERRAKQFIAEMVQIFATKLILQLGASLTTGQVSASLLAQAASTGSGSLAGNVLNWASTGISAYRGGASLYGSFFGSTGGYTAAEVASNAAIMESLGGTSTMTAGGTTSSMAGMAVTAAWIAAIVAAMYQNDQWFQAGWRIDDQDDTSNLIGGDFNRTTDAAFRMLGFNDRWASLLSGSSFSTRIFGHRQRQQDAVGVRGSIGFGGITGENWQDWSEQGGTLRGDRRGTHPSPFSEGQTEFFAEVMANIGRVTSTLAEVLGVDAGAVLGSYTRDFNLQLNENGEPLSDEEMGALFSTLFTEVLQDQVTALFTAAGESELADYVEKLKGTSDEVRAQIIEVVTIFQGLELLDLKGLDFSALQDWQKDGETIGQTFGRVAESWMALQEQFTPATVKIDLARSKLADLGQTLGRAGLEMPKTGEQWLSVMKSLDLSTQAGRDLFDQMIALAPAFDAVAQASAQAMDTFDALMGRLRGPAYTENLQGLQLSGAISSFMAGNAWTAGMSQADFLVQLRTITREDFAGYSAVNQQLILTILGLDNTMSTVGDQVAQGVLQGTQAHFTSTNYGSISDAIIGNLNTLSSSVTPTGDSLMERLLLRRGLVEERLGKLAERQAQLEARPPGGVPLYTTSQALADEYIGIQDAIQRLRREVEDPEGLTSDINHLGDLIAQFGDSDVASQIFELEEWYEGMVALAGNSPVALEALRLEFEARWAAILEGATEGLLSALEQAKERLRDWVDSLALDQSLSPLGPEAMLQEAEAQYASILSLAQENDVDAIGRLPDVARRYLELARQQFGSGVAYNAIYDRIVRETTGVADSPSTSEAIVKALPADGGQIMSSKDAAALKESMDALSAAIMGKGLTVTDDSVVAAIAALAEALRNKENTGLLAQGA